jgi:hypothetical protein
MPRDHPHNLRLTRILEWADARRRRRLRAHDIGKALQATEFVCRLEALIDQLALADVTPYRGHG